METAPLNALSPLPLPPGESPAVDREWDLFPALDAATLERSGAALTRQLGLVAKRIIDFTGAAAGLTLLFPVLLLIGVLIQLDSTGPVLFRQRRLGRHGRTFWIYKFRTMRQDAE